MFVTAPHWRCVVQQKPLKFTRYHVPVFTFITTKEYTYAGFDAESAIADFVVD